MLNRRLLGPTKRIGGDMLLKGGETCVRATTADRAALLVDMQVYFKAAKAAMQAATNSVYFLNWAFEQDTFLDPGPDMTGDKDDRIGNFLKKLSIEKPSLDIRILCWASVMPVAATQRFFPFADWRAFKGTRVKFKLDNKLPLGACHHQKMLIVDDKLAFCGGGDIGPDRWDTPEHLDDDPRREKTRRDHRDFDSRHEVMGIVDGEAASMLAEVFRERWLRATGETVEPAPSSQGSPWPSFVEPQFQNVSVGASRTYAAWRGRPAVREVEALHLESIRRAERLIYMENQYFTAPLIAEALAERLSDPGGPEVLLVSTQHSPSYFDKATMDKTRYRFIRRLEEADRHGRFRIYSPCTRLGKIIIVHAKLSIIDDRLLRVASANMNNRSLGFDSECDLSLEMVNADQKAQLDQLRAKLLAHWFGCPLNVVRNAVTAAEGRWCVAVDALREQGLVRLRPISAGDVSGLPGLIADLHIGDPVSAADSWKPWTRRAALQKRAEVCGLDPAGVN